jgi:hypothetical protein
MSKVIVNNVIEGVNDVEAHRDGYYAHRPDGRLEIQQTLLVAYLAAVEKLERLHSFAKDALEKGAAVEAGAVEAGIFNEPAKKPNWRAEFVKLGGDPKAVNDATPKQDNHRFRVFNAGEKQKGTLLAPNADGAPVAPPVKAGAEAAPE